MDEIVESPRGKQDPKKTRFGNPLISPISSPQSSPKTKRTKGGEFGEEKRAPSIVLDVNKENSTDHPDSISAADSFECQDNHVSFENEKGSFEEQKQESDEKAEQIDSIESQGKKEEPNIIDENDLFEEPKKEEEEKKEKNGDFDDFVDEKEEKKEEVPSTSVHDAIQKNLHVFATEPKTPPSAKEPIVEQKENNSFDSFDDDEAAASELVKPNIPIIKQDFSDSADEQPKQEEKNSDDENFEDIFSDM